MGSSVDGSPWRLLGLAGAFSEREGCDIMKHMSGVGPQTDVTVITLYQ